MANISKLLRMAFNVIIFFIAISILYIMSHEYNELVTTSMDEVSESDMLQEAEPIDTANYTTKTELLAILMKPLEYNIEIINSSGRYAVMADEYSPDNIGLYPVANNNYTKSYLYNMDGTISRIIFQYIS